MTTLNFPDFPTVGERYIGGNGVTYYYDGIKWLIVNMAINAFTSFIEGGSAVSSYDPLGLHIDGGSATSVFGINDINFDGGNA